MSAIGGKKRENNGEFGKKVGLFTATVLCVNPTEKEYKDILGMELKEDSKATEYVSERDGNTLLRVDFWLENTKKNAEGEKDRPYKMSFFLEDKVRENKDGTKTQYINSIGNCAWADTPEHLPDWFCKREYREAYSGEEDLYEFMRAWLNKLDYRDAETALELDWKKLMKGNVKDIKDQVNGEWAGEVGCLATVIVKEVEGEPKEYQGVYNRGFISTYSLKHFRLVDYDNPEVVTALGTKENKDLKPYERFVLKVTGEYGCKDFFKLKDIKDYDPNENPVSTNAPTAPLTEGGSDY
jgi:hypothetical protein